MNIRDHVWEPMKGWEKHRGNILMIKSMSEEQLKERTMELALLLSEHPASKPYLEKFNLCWGVVEGKVALGCARCSLGMCDCDDSGSRAASYGVACYCDPAIRPVFDDLGLAVRL